MKPARYIFLNRGLYMSAGKCAAQAAHAETLAMVDALNGTADADWNYRQADLFKKWYGDGHYAKYIMTADDAIVLYSIDRYLRTRDFKTYVVIDEGHTEGTYFVPTAMAVELVDKDDDRVASIFKEFRLYRDKKQNMFPTPESKDPPLKKRRWSRR